MQEQEGVCSVAVETKHRNKKETSKCAASKVTLTRRQRWEGSEFVSDISKVFYTLVHLKQTACSVICGFANLCRAEQNTEGRCHAVSAASLQYLHAINSNESDDMLFLALSRLPRSDWWCLWPLVLRHLSILGGHLEPDTLSPQSSQSTDTAINCF